MKKVIKIPCPKTPSEDDFSRIEGILGGPLPADYREFIIENNGGIATDPNGNGVWRFKYLNPTNRFFPDQFDKLDRFFSVGVGKSERGFNDVLDVYDSLRVDDETLPSDLLPIGETCTSSVVALSLGVRAGAVVLCSNGLVYEAGHIVLARSFSDFVDSLYLYDPDQE